MTGTACPSGDQVETDYGDASPDASGSWRVTGVVDQDVQVGVVPLEAECLATPSKYEVFTYRAVRTRVLTFRHLRVSPAVPSTGTKTLIVQSVGPCPPGSGSNGEYWAAVTLTNPPRSIPLVTADSVQQNVSGQQWSAVISIPEGLSAGRFVVSASCTTQRFTLSDYTPLSFTVSAS
jgi:hypothetical protein